VISVGGFDYADNGLSGAFTKNESASPSLIDSLSPIAVYSSVFGSSFDFAGGFANKGQRRRTTSTPTAIRPPMPGMPRWPSWVGRRSGRGDLDVPDLARQAGRIPVSMTITASSLVTPTSDASVIYTRSFDITRSTTPGTK